MRFQSVKRHPEDVAAQRAASQTSINTLLEEGKRIAVALTLQYKSRHLLPMARTASAGVVRAQVRRCIAALGNADKGALKALRDRLGQAIININMAPNESTAKALFASPQVQELLWSWSTAEASIYVKNLTPNAPIDEDKRADLVGDAVMGFMREEAKRAGANKMNPFMMARSWEPARMADPLGTFRAYLMAWAKKYVYQFFEQQANEGVSLDAPVGGSGDSNGTSIGEMIADKPTANPETALFSKNDHRAQVAAMTALYQRQVAGLEEDISGLEGKTDGYSVGQRTTLQNRLVAIKEMVAPLLDRLQSASAALSKTEADKSPNSEQRERKLVNLRGQFEEAMQNLTAISDAQDRAHSTRFDRENEGGSVSVPSANKKLVSDHISTARAYARARENAERLLPHVYRSLTHRKNTDLSQKFTANILTNWRLLDGIDSQHDLDTALSPEPAARAKSNDRALFSTTALRTMMVLRDLYTYDEKHSVIRGENEKVPKSAKQRFIVLMRQEVENDPVLRARAPQMLDLLKDFVAGNGFRTLWENTDYTSRAAAYELARNEKVNKRWSDLSPDESNQVADEASNLLYNNDYRPLATWSRGDSQQRPTRDLKLTPQERQEIMRQEAERITEMMRGTLPRAMWAHGEPADSGRFHDKPRATTPAPPMAPAAPESNDYTTSSSATVIRSRRFATA